MRIEFILVMVTVMAGCAMTPADIRHSPYRETIVRPGHLTPIALCIVRGLDDQIRTQNDLRIEESSGRAEIIANHSTKQGIGFLPGSLGEGPSFVVDMESVGDATQVTYYVRSDYFHRDQMRTHIREVVNSC